MSRKRPMTPRQAKRMQAKMRQVDLDGVEEVIIRFPDKEIAIISPMTVMKQFIPGMKEYDTFQIIGEGIERPRGSDDGAATSGVDYTDDDVKLVMSQTGASEDEVRKVLAEENGDLAGAIVKLKTK